MANTTHTTETTTEINLIDTTWIITATALIFLMLPGVGFFYRGAVAYSKNKLSLLFSSFSAATIVLLQWFLCGYSLCFSTGYKFIGSFDHVALINVGATPHEMAPTIPASAFMLNQGVMAAVAPLVLFGSVAERASLRVYLIFTFFWTTLVYDFISYWLWGIDGWLKEFHVLDFGGGTPVHIGAGFSALAYAIVTGPREDFLNKKLHPVDISEVYMGTFLMWFAWFGFNGSGDFKMNTRTVNSLIVTNFSACAGGFTWVITEMIYRKTTKMSLFGLCSGCVAGLASITPACGFVSPASSLFFGALAGVICCLTSEMKNKILKKYDDVCDVFAVHGIGGVVGTILTGIFADNAIATMSGAEPIKGGWINNNYIQIVYQILGVAVTAAWSFILTVIILSLINLIPFCKIRVSEKAEAQGIDWHDLGEYAYGHDIIIFKEIDSEKTGENISEIIEKEVQKIEDKNIYELQKIDEIKHIKEMHVTDLE